MDKAGRLVIPKGLREQIGLEVGEVDITVDGAALRVEAVQLGQLVESSGRLVVTGASASPLSDDVVQALRDADQR